MRQKLHEEHRVDEHSRPAGGTTTGTGIHIDWQDGPLGRGEDRKEPNGAFVEGVIEAAEGRLRHYQDSRFACRENFMALVHLEQARHWLEARTRVREEQDVEGTHEVHNG